MDNKFRSDRLVGILGTDDLTKVLLIRSNTNRKIYLNEGYLRSRLSYIQQVNDGDTIQLLAQP